MQLLKDLRSIGISLHLITNLILALSFFILKTTKPICTYLFEDCYLELREWELLTFLGCIIVIKNRKQSTYIDYLETACLFAKVLNGYMYYRTNVIVSVIYGLLCLFHMIFLPKPGYKGPEFITYFRESNLQEELERDKRIVWVVCFYAAWSPQCVNFAPIFSEISSEYHLDNLRFGKIDISRYPEAGKHFNVDSSSWSKQLPSVILFKDGKEDHRKPFISPKGTVVRHKFHKVRLVIISSNKYPFPPPITPLCNFLAKKGIE
ncbi:hypothetical protein FSP39_014888 [Pinctada imbricata]|uniref:Thioredoxin domain-containing protein n=1 Tax=Pinctada imbricata TaxID=66713 RepID=A0AA88XKD4_PINIB|nr:hypothetical protein FSP39_014888 [Pinctada imbricata]